MQELRKQGESSEQSAVKSEERRVSRKQGARSREREERSKFLNSCVLTENRTRT
jgi:hypothetical protein